MGAQRVLILGGGFGGLTVASELRRRLAGRVELVVVDRQPWFRMGFRKISLLVGRAAPDEGVRSRRALAEQGIRFVEAEITRIDPGARAVETTAGPLEGDYLVVALGAEPRPDLVPGFREAPNAFSLYDVDSVLAARERLQSLRRGRILVAILGLPIKCPPAPFEAALLVDELLRERGLRGDVELRVTTPQPASVPVTGPAGCQAIESQLALRGIPFHPNRRVERVTPEAVAFADGPEPYDLLLGAPPHRVPEVVRQSGLTDGGEWVRVDPRTLRTRFDRVYAIGDVVEIAMANGMPLPKAGVFAEGAGRVVAGAIAAEVAGEAAPAPFDGRGHCYVELGGGLATVVRGVFLAEPAPEVEVAPPSPEFLAEKRRFEEERLRAWFGS